MWTLKYSHLSHDFVLTFLHIPPITFHNSLQEPEALNVLSLRCDAVDEVLDHTVTDLVAQLIVVHEDVTHRLHCVQELVKNSHDHFGWWQNFKL